MTKLQTHAKITNRGDMADSNVIDLIPATGFG